jgi:hypothetical protein
MTPGQKNIDLFGWDTVFTVSYETANAAIVAAGSTPSGFKYTDSANTGATIAGTWSPWQITTGGDGQNLNLVCKIATGTASDPGSESLDLAGCQLVIQIKLEALPDPAKAFTNKTLKPGTGIAHALKPKLTGTATDPAVAVISNTFNFKGLLAGALPQIFQEYFEANLVEFDHTFAVMMVSAESAKDDFQWLKPTAVSYACADSSDGSMAKSVFAVLAMTQDNPVGTNQQAIDNRMLTNLPTGENSAFGISDAQVLAHIFLPGAVQTIQGATAANFTIGNDNISIKNNSNITWGNFKLENGDVVSPTIQAENFEMSMAGSEVTLTITGASFAWPSWHGPGSIDVTMNITQVFQFGLKQKADGNYVFCPTNMNVVKNVTSVVTQSEGVEIFDICLLIGTAIITSVLGGILDSALSAGAVTTENAGGAIINISEDDIDGAVDSGYDADIEDTDEDAAENGQQGTDNQTKPGYIQRLKTALWASKFKMLGGVLGSILGTTPTVISQFYVLYAKNQLDTIPPFNSFSEECLGAVVFPHTKGWNLSSANLQGPLVIGGTLTGDSTADA